MHGRHPRRRDRLQGSPVIHAKIAELHTASFSAECRQPARGLYHRLWHGGRIRGCGSLCFHVSRASCDSPSVPALAIHGRAAAVGLGMQSAYRGNQCPRLDA